MDHKQKTSELMSSWGIKLCKKLDGSVCIYVAPGSSAPMKFEWSDEARDFYDLISRWVIEEECK